MEEIRKIVREQIEEVLSESRMMTYGMKIASDIKKHVPGIEKLLGLKSTGSSMVALFRYEDGNVYEIEITPGSLIKDKDFWGNVLKKKVRPEDEFLKQSKKIIRGDDDA